MEILECRIVHKVLHNSRDTDKHPPIALGKAIVRVSQGNIFGQVRYEMGGVEDVPAFILEAVRPAVREQCRSFLKDRKFQIIWNEDNGIETTWKAL